MKNLDTLEKACGVEQNLALLAQAERLLAGLDAAVYTEPCEAVFAASIGQHLRHAIEHYEAVLRASETNGVVDYEHRHRDLTVESDPQTALRRISEITAALATFDQENIPLTVLDHGGGAHPSHTSLGRELQFLASHTVHHFAMIGIIARLTGLVLDPSFGIAPSTLRHRNHD